MKDLLDVGLFLAGLGFTVLVIASFWIPKVLGWKEKLADLSPLMKELWWTYAAYVLGSHCFFAIVSLCFRDWLLSGDPSAAAMSGFILIWWMVRLYLQFFGFDLGEVANTRFNKLAKHLLTLLFIYLVGIFGAVLWWNLGGVP
jgi:hypothetical protein